MSIYQKLQAVRDAIREAKLEKSGKGQGMNGNWSFYELEDFWPKAVELFKEHNLFTHTSANKELAILTIVDIMDDDVTIQFTAPFSPASDRSLHPCQNVGWGLTYLYRRLYLSALDLIEKDPVDGGEKTIQAKDNDPMERFEKED